MIMTEKDIQKLYAAQEKAYLAIIDAAPDAQQEFVLIGGTPLARCWLGHRVSFDLDFAVNPACQILDDIHQIFKRKKNINTSRVVINPEIYGQLFYDIKIDGISIQFSFVEDRSYKYFKSKHTYMGETRIKTVDLDTLYFNKVRALSGDFEGAERVKIRDAFDLLALSKKYMRLNLFLDELESKFKFFSKDMFLDRLASFPWHQVSGQEIFPYEPWTEYTDIGILQSELCLEAGFLPKKNDYWKITEDEDDGPRP